MRRQSRIISSEKRLFLLLADFFLSESTTLLDLIHKHCKDAREDDYTTATRFFNSEKYGARARRLMLHNFFWRRRRFQGCAASRCKTTQSWHFARAPKSAFNG
jgi:hypothetical protein